MQISNQDSSNAEWMKKYDHKFQALKALNANFDLEQKHEFTAANGWHIDSYHTELPPEPPGPPLERNSFAIAKDIMFQYKFPDPSRIRGIFEPNQELGKRIMLLEAKFMGLSFEFAVKIHNVVDETRTEDGRQVQVWGYSYYTLQGHFEMGEISFLICKWIDTGKIEFRISAYSKAERIPSFFYRIGFKIFGRSLQKEFAQKSLSRIKLLVAQELSRIASVPNKS